MNRFVRAATLCAAFAFVGTPAALAFPPACTVLKCDAARKESKMYSDQAAQMRNGTRADAYQRHAYSVVHAEKRIQGLSAFKSRSRPNFLRRYGKDPRDKARNVLLAVCP